MMRSADSLLMFMCFEFEPGRKVNSGPFVLSSTPPSPVSSASFVIRPLLPRGGPGAGNRSRANEREDGKESEVEDGKVCNR